MTSVRPNDLIFRPDHDAARRRAAIVHLAAFLGTCLAGCIAACLALTGCASSGGGGESSRAPLGVQGMVLLKNFQTGHELRIVSDSWVRAAGYEGDDPDERRVAFYSEKDRGLQAKVCEDAVFEGIEEALRLAEFDAHASLGPTPSDGGGARNTVELWVDGAPRHLAFRPGDSDAKGRAYQQSMIVVSDVYNGLTAYLAQEGAIDFERQTQRPRRRN